MFSDLESLDHSFRINLNSIDIRKVDLDKITKAWACGHFIFTDTNNFDINNIGIGIYSVTSKSSAYRDGIEITKDWQKIADRLAGQDIPDEWVNEALEKALEKEDWLHE